MILCCKVCLRFHTPNPELVLRAATADYYKFLVSLESLYFNEWGDLYFTFKICLIVMRLILCLIAALIILVSLQLEYSLTVCGRGRRATERRALLPARWLRYWAVYKGNSALSGPLAEVIGWRTFVQGFDSSFHYYLALNRVAFRKNSKRNKIVLKCQSTKVMLVD